MRKTARSAVVVMTVVVVADLVAAMIVVDHRRAVMDRAVGRRRGVMALALARVLQVPVVGSDPVVKEVLRVVMATTVVVRRVVLGIVTGMARPSVSSALNKVSHISAQCDQSRLMRVNHMARRV